LQIHENFVLVLDMTSVPDKSKTPRKGTRAAAHGRFPSNIEIGSIQGLISNTNEEGLDLIQGMLSQRRARIELEKASACKTPQYEGIGSGGGGTPSGAKPRGKLWDREILKDLPAIIAWGALSPSDRSADKETLRLASILTGAISRLKTSNLSNGEILSILKGVGTDAEVAKAISVGNLLDTSFDQDGFTANGKVLWTRLSAYVSTLVEPIAEAPAGAASEEMDVSVSYSSETVRKRKRFETLGETLFDI
jgi:hypothetical protein